MEVKIGVQNAIRELIIDSPLDVAELEKAIDAALSGTTTFLALTDTKGRKVIVPTEKLAYIEVGSPAVGAVGFRS